MQLHRAFTFVCLIALPLAGYACVGDSAIPSGSDDAGVGGNDGAVGNTTDGSVFQSGNDAGQTADTGPAACDGGLMCGAACIAVSTSSANCGACGHDCGMGSICANGLCGPVLVTGTPDGGAKITALSTDQPADNPKAQSTHIFWSVSGTGAGVYQDNVAGGNVIMLSANQSNSLSVHNTDVYWMTQNFGGAPQPMFKGSVGQAMTQIAYGTFNANFLQDLVFDPASSNMYGSYKASTTTFGAFKCTGVPPATCSSMITYTGTVSGNVATDGTSLYVPDSDNNIIDKITLPGGSATQAALNQSSPTLVRVDGTFLYWSNSGTKTLFRETLAGGTPKQIASTTNPADGIAADAVNAYWTDGPTGIVSFAPIGGSGPTTQYVKMGGASSTPMLLVRDTKYLYFTYSSAIWRVALP